MRRRIRSAVRRCVVAIEDNWRMTRDDARKAFLVALLAIPISVVVAISLGVAIIAVIMALAIVIAVLGLVSVVLAIVLVIVPHDPNTDTEGSRGSFNYLSDIRRGAEGEPEWEELKLATTELKGKESQLELRRIAREIDTALSGIELMAAFPGHCDLCPV